MPSIIVSGKNTNIVKIEPNPKRQPTVKVKMDVLNIAGGSPKYTTSEDGSKKYSTVSKVPKNLTRLPNTIVMYSAPLGKSGLITGLDEIVDNPYKDLEFYRPGWDDILRGNKKIRRQELLEYKHGREKGFYTNQVSTTISSSKLSEAPYFQRSEARVLLNDGVTYLDLNNPIDEVNYYMLRAHNMIANSYEELEHNQKATHYIVDETERSNRESEGIRKANKFGARLEEIMQLNDATIVEFCKALNIRGKGTTNSDHYAAIHDFVKRGDNEYDEFMDVYELWKDPVSREIFHGYVELFDFMTIPGLLTTRNNKIFWSQPASEGGKRDAWEWKSKDQFVRQFLVDPRYQEEVETLRSQYRAKTRY